MFGTQTRKHIAQYLIHEGSFEVGGRRGFEMSWTAGGVTKKLQGGMKTRWIAAGMLAYAKYALNRPIPTE